LSENKQATVENSSAPTEEKQPPETNPNNIISHLTANINDYVLIFQEQRINTNPAYPHNDIGIASLFYDLHSDFIRYVLEAKTW